MSRAAVPGLPSRYPIGAQLPALYAEDDFAQRFTAGLDTLLAPVFATLDNLPAYFDPRLAPADFLAWTAGWVGLEADPDRPEGLTRAAVARAVELHRWRGTRRGLVERLRLTCGVGAEIVDGGGVSWSATPGSALPPAPTGELLVRAWPLPEAGGHGDGVRDGDGARPRAVDEDQVRAVVEASCPVHLSCRVEILPGPPAGAPGATATGGN